MNATIEDVRHIVSSDSFADMVQKANDNLNITICIQMYAESAPHLVEADCNHSGIESTDLIAFSADYSSEPLSTPGPGSATPRNVSHKNSEQFSALQMVLINCLPSVVVFLFIDHLIIGTIQAKYLPPKLAIIGTYKTMRI